MRHDRLPRLLFQATCAVLGKEACVAQSISVAAVLAADLVLAQRADVDVKERHPRVKAMKMLGAAVAEERVAV
eukprot:3809990-Prorocentrum_lima.AAC.1